MGTEADAQASGEANPLRVTYVIPGLGTGGAEHSLAELLGHGFDGAVEASVVCLHRREEGVQERVVEELGTPVRWLTGRRTWARARELRAILREDRPDLVVSSVYEADMVARLAVMGPAGPPLLSTLVNSQYHPSRAEADPNVSRWGLQATRLLDAVSGRLATDHYIALTHAVAAHGVERLRIPRARITVVPRGRARARMGLPSQERRRAGREALGVETDRPVIVTVGRCEYQKGQRFLIEAMKAVVAEHPAALLLVAGRVGNASTELADTIDRLGLEANVRLLGHHEDVASILAVADLFAFPSLWEGFGGALIEALAMDLPVVVSDLPELREVLGGPPSPGVLVPPGEAAALAQALVGLLDRPEEAKCLGAAGRERFESSFELDRVAAATLSVYRHVAGRRGRVVSTDRRLV